MENLGKKAKDKVTGFEGIIISKVNYLYGSDQYGILSKCNSSKDKFPITHWFDVRRIDIIGEGVSTGVQVYGNSESDNSDLPF